MRLMTVQREKKKTAAIATLERCRNTDQMATKTVPEVRQSSSSVNE